MQIDCKELNEIITLDKPNLIVLGSKRKTGKSTVALNIVNNLGIINKKSVLYFNLEISKDIIASHLFCINSNIDYFKFCNGELKDKDWNNLADVVKEFDNTEIYIDDTHDISVEEICSTGKYYKKEKDIKMIVIDSLQLINDDVSETICQLKELSEELNIPILITSQLLKIENNKPTVDSFYEPKLITENANTILILYKDEQDKLKIEVAKNDYGECKDISL